MARDDRQIKSAVRMPATEEGPRRTFRTEDDVEALAEAATPEQLQRLHDEGAITGTWKGVTASEEGEEEGGTRTSRKSTKKGR